MRDVVTTEAAPKAIGPYSQAVVVDGWLFCSGQIPLDPQTGQMVAVMSGARRGRSSPISHTSWQRLESASIPW